MESWYAYWGVGYARTLYSGELGEMLARLRDLPVVDHYSLGIDTFGFYWPWPNEQTLVGGIINGFVDRYEVGGEWVQINGYLYSLSAMRFFSKRIGRGVFYRGDLGFARYAADASYASSRSGDWGAGALFGVGIGVPVSSGTRLLLNLNYALRRADGQSTGSFCFSVGGLF